jgi:hypothetical protein
MEELVGQLMELKRTLDVAKEEAQDLYETYTSLPVSHATRKDTQDTYSEKRENVWSLQTQIDDLLVGRWTGHNLQTQEARRMMNQTSPGAETWMNVPSYDQSRNVWEITTPKWEPQPQTERERERSGEKNKKKTSGFCGSRPCKGSGGGGVRTQRSKKRTRMKRSNKKRTRMKRTRMKRTRMKRTRMKRSNKKRTRRSRRS